MSRGVRASVPRGVERVEVAAALRVQYEAGATLRDLAASTGWSYGAVHQLLVQADTAFRPRGGRRKLRPEPAVE